MTLEIALLLLTSWRWYRCTAGALARVCQLLSDLELDALSLPLLGPGKL